MTPTGRSYRRLAGKKEHIVTSSATTQKIQTANRATPEQVWHALTDGSITPAYYYGFAAEFNLTAGEPYRYHAGNLDTISGTVVAVEPGKSLVTTFNGAYDPDVAALPESTVTFTVSDDALPLPGVTLLSIEHVGLPESNAAVGIETGWVVIASGLKTLLETGAPLVPAPTS